MTGTRTVVLITGATGYIGGHLLSQLLKLNFPSIEFRAIVRDATKAQRLEDEFGVKGIIGSHSDQDLMSKAASEADVVLATADCNDAGAAEGILLGLKRRFEATGKASILIHTSGVGVFAHDPSKNGDGTVWDDGNSALFDSVPDNAIHRPSELLTLAADREGKCSHLPGYVKTYIISPATVFGVARNLLVDAGISNSRTVFFKIFIPASISRGSGISIGGDEVVWPNVSINDLIDFYLLLFNTIVVQLKDLPHGEDGYFVVGDGHHKWTDVFQRISQTLSENGAVKMHHPVLMTREESLKVFGAAGPVLYDMISSDIRTASSRARKLGWKPVEELDFLETVPDEVQFILQHRVSRG